MYSEQEDAPVRLIDFDDVCWTVGMSGIESDEILGLQLLHSTLIGYDFDVLSQSQVALALDSTLSAFAWHHFPLKR
jgi:hypothetical protein